MARYESMEHYRQHLTRLHLRNPFSDLYLDEIIFQLGMRGALKSKTLIEAIGPGVWDSLYRGIIAELIETDPKKSSHRWYSLTEAGGSYYNLLNNQIPRDEDRIPLKVMSAEETIVEELEPESESDSVSQQEPEQEPTKQSAAQTMTDLNATFLQSEQVENIKALQSYYECLLIADKINRKQGAFLVSVEVDHLVIQVNGSAKDREQIMTILEHIQNNNNLEDNHENGNDSDMDQ
jgi:hypothetical protein